MGHGATQAAYLDWKVYLLGNIGCMRSTNAQGAVFVDLTPLPELAELREVVYFGDGKKHLGWDYLKALTPLSLAVWVMDDGCFTFRSKGLQERTKGGTGRLEICVEAMSPGSRDARGSPAGRTCSTSDFTRGARSQVIRSSPLRRRTNCTSSSRPTFIRRWPTSSCHGSAGSSRSSRRSSAAETAPGAGEDPRHPRQAADEVDAPLRHRGRGHRTTTSSTA